MTLVRAFVGSVLALGLGSTALAENFPNKVVRVVLPFPAGSAADIVTRTVSQKLAELWNQPVIVENRPGAGGTIGVAAVAKAPADGHVLLAHSSTYAVSPALHADLPYDPARDLVEIAPIGTQPYVLAVGPSAGLATLAELIAAAKGRPGQINFGSAGMGTSTHVVAEKFRSAAGIDVVHVPYKAVAEANADTMSGRIAYWFPPLGLALPLVRAGKLQALAVTSHRRTSFLPDVPTIDEAGIAGLQDTNWFGMWAPARTPSSVIDKIAADVARTLAAPDVRDRLHKTGTEAMSMTPKEFTRFVRSEMESAARAVKASGIKSE